MPGMDIILKRDADIREQELAKLPVLPTSKPRERVIVDSEKLDRFLSTKGYDEQFWAPDIASLVQLIPEALGVVVMNKKNAVFSEGLSVGAHGCIYTASSVFWRLTTKEGIEFHLFISPVDLPEGRLLYLGVYSALDPKQKLSLGGWEWTLEPSERKDTINFVTAMGEGNYEREKSKGKNVARPPSGDVVQERYDSGIFQLNLYVLEHKHWDSYFVNSLVASGTSCASYSIRRVKRKPVPYHLLDEILIGDAEKA